MAFSGNLRRIAIDISLAVALILLIFGGLAVTQLRPAILNRPDETQMSAVIEHFHQTLVSLGGQSDPQVMAEIATGDYLADLIEMRCIDCPSVQVARSVNVVDLQILDYPSEMARVYARIEYGWNRVNPATGQVAGACHAQAFSSIYLLVWQDEMWKVAGLQDTIANRVYDTPQLLAQYCGDN